MKEEIFMLKMNGYCCSQIIMELGLKQLGKENPDLVEAMAGLCDGVKCGKICGAASAAGCLIYLADGEGAERGLVQEYLDWFEETFGALDCDELLGDDPMAKMEKCPMFVESTMLKLEELLEWE
ncbi:MAG: C-GCAxxG-C-C family protein [Bacillota bacterium]|nr:C-GCAxxG-C-C family protein [Bacillota bacterium]